MKKFLVFLAAMLLVFGAVGTASAYSSADSYADAAQPTWTAITPGTTVTYFSGNSATVAYAENNLPESVGPVNDPVNAIATVSFAEGEGYADQTYYYVWEEAFASTGELLTGGLGSIVNHSYADASAGYTWSIFVNQAGSIQFDLAYYFEQALSTTSLGDFAMGYSEAYLFVDAGAGGQYTFAWMGEAIGTPNSVYDGDDYSDVFSGDILYTAAFPDAGYYTLAYGVMNWSEAGSSPPGVPEPATMVLLGSGLVGLAGLGRKKFFKKA